MSHIELPSYLDQSPQVSARFAKLKDAGHWLHADKPREYEAAVRTFLGL